MEFKAENSQETAAQRAVKAYARRGGVFLALDHLRRPSVIRCRKHPPSVYLIHRSESRDFVFHSSGELKSPWAELIPGQWDGWKPSAEIALHPPALVQKPSIYQTRTALPRRRLWAALSEKLLTSGPKRYGGWTAHFFSKMITPSRPLCIPSQISFICSLVIKHLNTLKVCSERAGLQTVSDFIRHSDSGCGNGRNQCRLWLSAANQNVTRDIDSISGVIEISLNSSSHSWHECQMFKMLSVWNEMWY